MAVTDPTDPVLVRRERWRLATDWGKRIGYLLYAVAMVTFFIGLFTRFGDGHVRIIVIAMAIGSALLAPAIVMSYAVKAADREDRIARGEIPPGRYH